MNYRPVSARLPVPAGLGRLLVLTTVFVCAACGLVYELELVALASSLIGDSVTQASVVLSVMVFAMGVGSLLAKWLRGRAAAGFALVEVALALLGGLSAMALYACFAWFGHMRPALVAFSLAIGVLIGAEVPLLMTLIQRIRRQDAGGAVAELFAADYVGALVGGLAFPFLLLPVLGQLTGALVTGAVNAVAGGALVLWLFRRDLSTRARWVLVTANCLVLLALAACSVLTAPFERAARRAVYGGDVRIVVQTDRQQVVVTGGAGGKPLSLFLDGRLRAGGGDPLRYPQALVHPAMAGPHRRVLLLGGGDGLALREVLRYPDVASVTMVEPDAEVVRLARSDPGLAALNDGAFRDRRVTVDSAWLFNWLRGHPAPSAPFDVVICDLPDPRGAVGVKLYSQEFYGLVTRQLAPGGRLAVHAGELSEQPHTFWTVDATVRSVGLYTLPYQVRPEPDGGHRPDWGLLLASRTPVVPRLPQGGPVPRTLTPQALASAVHAAELTREDGLLPSTLMHPRY
ncbi:polyamine aminopropyltransferase [Streptomyces orinoci]|uniref:Polyamine aminopropyltransferase n=1 Tax=Streptomyces orinoci TaxID=67339 RepID=A0ABV3K1J1_STRON|nr:polyamine aminopropyltransferase [Streptomyces orinoci]